MTEQPWEWHPDGPEAQAMLEQAQAERPNGAYVWTRNDRADHEAGHPSGYDCDGYAMSGRERCAHIDDHDWAREEATYREGMGE